MKEENYLAVHELLFNCITGRFEQIDLDIIHASLLSCLHFGRCLFFKSRINKSQLLLLWYLFSNELQDYFSYLFLENFFGKIFTQAAWASVLQVN